MTERFTLLTELGRGGMGVVWKARDEETGQIVALKLLREAYAEDPEYLARFERELELARRIDSVHVVKVLGFGVRQRVPYLALEFVDGPSLHDLLLAHGPYNWAETRALLIQLTQGLADANAAGVIHRDVKPSNVLIGPDGIAKLTDFGISRGLDTTRMTATSTMLGTPAYLAPEGPKDARSDLYSLGIIGYELLTGAVPFKGTSHQEIIFEHVRTAPDLDKLPPEARPIIGMLLAKDPAERPQRASALLPILYGVEPVPTPTAAQRSAVQPEPIPASPVVTPTQSAGGAHGQEPQRYPDPVATTSAARRSKVPVATALAAVAAVVCLVAVALMFGLPGRVTSPAVTSKPIYVSILVRNLSGRELIVRVHAHGQWPAVAFSVPAVSPHDGTDTVLQTVATDVPANQFDPPIEYDVLYGDCTPLQLALQIEEIDMSGNGASMQVSADGIVSDGGGGLLDDIAVPRTTNCLDQAGASTDLPTVGVIVWSPSPLSCSAPADVKVSALLPATVHSGDIVTMEIDRPSSLTASFRIQQATASPVPNENSEYIAQQADGTWLVVAYETAEDVQVQCGQVPANDYTPGDHTVDYLDQDGNVLAHGEFTVTP